jgi:sugar-specific transcriptional regulator TrmB
VSLQDFEDLVDFGLTVLQARTYLTLLKLGNARASQVSSIIGTVRPETYRVLRELSAKGLIERSPGTPLTFSALPPKLAIPLLLTHFRNRFRELDRKHRSLIESLRTQASDSEIFHDRVSLTFATTDNHQQKTILMIKQVRGDYVAIISKSDLRLMSGEGLLGKDYLQAIIRAKRRGVRIRIITEVDESNLKCSRSLSRHVELRKLRDVLPSMHIFDKREMIFGPASTDKEIGPEKSTRNADLWTNNTRFIEGMYAMFEKLWS